MDSLPVETIASAVARFVAWLDRFGETSYDHQSFFAGALGRRAKALYYRRPRLGTLAAAPMVFCEALVPSARRWFWKPQRFPIADAHYAMGFASLAERSGDERYYRSAVHFLEVLEQTRCPGHDEYCWGYPFDWQTRSGCVEAGTPLITTQPYIYEAFSAVYRLDNDERWRRVMASAARHAFTRYRDLATSAESATCTYTPAADDRAKVVNASAYRAFLLTQAGVDFNEPRYLDTARRNVNFVLDAQQADGSWPYSIDGQRHFVDHFHTCFVLKALAKIEALAPREGCARAIERGVAYYTTALFDADRLPKPFSKAPRFTVYRRELYDYAECINLGVLLRGRFPALDRVLHTAVSDLLGRWQKRDGSFRSRELLIGWDDVPMHRWAQSQAFRSLCVFLSSHARASREHLHQLA
jgi:hypothetical protein